MKIFLAHLDLSNVRMHRHGVKDNVNVRDCFELDEWNYLKF
jgi:hypothetical protein